MRSGRAGWPVVAVVCGVALMSVACSSGSSGAGDSGSVTAGTAAGTEHGASKAAASAAGTGGAATPNAGGAAGADARPAVSLPPPPDNPHPASVSGLAPTPADDVPPVVVLEPTQRYAYPAPAQRPMMDQIATRFTPGSVVVRTGMPVDFRNDDSTLHNVRVRERGHGADDLAFNIALQQGITYDYTFATDDAWDVRCDMHQNMYGLVVSTSSPYNAVAQQDGTYSIDGVLPGEYLAIAYTSRARVEKPVVLKAGQRLKLDFKDTHTTDAR